MQDVVLPAVDAGALQGQDIERLLDYTDPLAVAGRVGTDVARIVGTEIEAGVAGEDLLLEVQNGRRQRLRFLGRLTQQKVRQPLGRLRTDGRELAELGNQPGNRLRERLRCHEVAVPPLWAVAVARNRGCRGPSRR